MTSKNTDLPLLDQLLTTRLDDKNSEATQGKSVPDCLNYPYAVLTWFEPEVVSCKGTNHRNCCRILVEVRSVSPAPSTARPIKRDWTAISFRALQGRRGFLTSPYRQQVPVVLECTLKHVYKIAWSLKLLLFVSKPSSERDCGCYCKWQCRMTDFQFDMNATLDETMQNVTFIKTT